MEDDLSKKQTYLRENILEKGYDAEDFMKLLQNKKGEQSLDLSCWSLDELKEAVKEFIKDNKAIIEDYEADEEKNSNEINNNNNSNVIFSLEKYCKENDYDLVWMNLNIEDVYLGKMVETKSKAKEAFKFQLKKDSIFPTMQVVVMQ